MRGLAQMCVIQIACGHGHILALMKGKEVLPVQLCSLGLTYFGPSLSGLQLQKENLVSKVVFFSRSASGSSFFPLIAGSQLYSWGDNQHGQLGIASTSKYEDTPQHVKCLTGLAVAHVATGASHCFVLTVSGALFGWGRNGCVLVCAKVLNQGYS